MPKLRNLPIIMCSMSRWDGPLSSAAYSLAKQLAHTNQVFYFDYPYTLKDYVKSHNDESVKKRKQALLKGKEIYAEVPDFGNQLKAVTPRLMVPFYFLPPGSLYDGVEKFNNRRFFKTVRQVLKDNGIERFIFFNSFCPFYGYELPADVKPEVFVYQTRDDLRAILGLSDHGPKYERLAASNADVVLATSSRLHEILEEETGRKVYLLPNAAHTQLFRKTVEEQGPKPKDFPDNGHQTIGFIGNIGPRMDLELMDQLLITFPEKNFVMIGPENLDGYDGPDIRRHPNLHLLGPKPLDQLPAYLRHVDATIIPFVKDELTRSIYPLKLNEQLAAGRAIVTMDFSRDVMDFSDVVYVAGSYDEFIKMVGEALQDNSPEKVKERVKRSEGNSWEDRVETFWEILEQQSHSNA